MSSYDDHPAVSGDGNGFTVQRDGADYRVLPNEAMGWGIYTGPNLDLVFGDNGPAIGFGDADTAIGALLDEPQAAQTTDTDEDGM